MIVNIVLDEPYVLSKNTRNPVSGFVSFPYNAELLQIVKSRAVRKWCKETKEWEIPYWDVADFAEQACAIADVQIQGKYISSDTEKAQLPDDFTFKTTPYAHQIDTLLFGSALPKFVLGDDQGAGKTKQIIDLFRLLKHQGKVKRALIICCVNGNKYNWQDEVYLHSDCKPWILGTRYGKRNHKAFIGTAKDRMDDLYTLPENIEFVITNIETLRLKPKGDESGHTYPIAERLRELCQEGEFGLVAIDEVHKNKNPESAQSKAAIRIQDEYMIPMSGTIILEKPFDLYFPLSWTGYEDHSFWQFKHMYGRYVGTELTGYKNLDILHNFIKPIMLRRMKEDIADLPEKIKTVEYVELGKEQRKIYEAVRNDLLHQIDKIRLSLDPLSQLIRLRQATGHAGILSTTCEDSVKMDRMEELVEDELLHGGKVIIFSNWTQITDRAADRLAKLSPVVVTGGVKQEARFPLIKAFQEDRTDICIGTIGALGTGFTLNKATLVIFLDEPWNRATKDQAEDRAHRIGTKKPVRIVTIIAKDTIDEHIHNISEEKGAMADFVVDGKLDMRRALDFVLNF